MTSIRFPDDLLILETAWLRTYEDMARLPRTAGATAHRRRLLYLSRRISAHPFWAVPGHPGATMAELRRQARVRRWVEAA
ncbi:hypothetical protein [Streptomyces sp. NPDC048606]|uniref:hypothetical protein n=1 Tax=Streptomyces sp. NPDC048606 TaxID=3154726 RepID=UPI003420BF03